ncbi:hypothetical protein DAI22_06g227003 [Oryza sativa Japonica Group]|nr:hypothetical protein DAI22_06g227003 [Oryza sativa Japonica Group]
MRRDDEGRAVKTARKRWGFVLCGCGGRAAAINFRVFWAADGRDSVVIAKLCSATLCDAGLRDAEAANLIFGSTSGYTSGRNGTHSKQYTQPGIPMFSYKVKPYVK